MATKQKAPSKKQAPSFLSLYNKTFGFSLGTARRFKWMPKLPVLFFLRAVSPTTAKQSLYLFDARTSKERLVLDVKQLLGKRATAKLTAAEKALRERLRMRVRGISFYRLAPTGASLLVGLGRHWYWSDTFLAGNAATWKRIPALDGGFDPRFSPDGKQIAFVRGGNVWLWPGGTKKAIRLTNRSAKTTTFGKAEFVAQEEMGRYRGFWWSPDGKMIAFQETSVAGVERMYISDPARPQRAPRGFAYPRPGKKNATVRLWLLTLNTKAKREIKWDRKTYPYLTTVRWSRRAPLTILVQNRRQTAEVLLRVAPSTGATTTLLTEKDAAWLNLDQTMPRWISRKKGFLWSTERRGQWQLELRSPKGALIRVLTPKSTGYRKLAGVEKSGRFLYVLGGPEPTERHVIKVPLFASVRGPRALTRGKGLHSIVYQPHTGLFLHRAYLWNGQVRSDVVLRTGRMYGSLRSVATPLPWLPKVEFATVGKHKWRTALVRPRTFVKGKTYPVIVHVYGGPHAQMVRAYRKGYMLDQWMADQGAIVVRVDGRGTPSRGRQWERIIKGNFVKVPLADLAAALKALGKRYKELDLTRVGIHGWSFGGYMAAMAVLRMPSLFKVAVAGAPVTDWALYDTFYTERYMGLPLENAMGYLRSSVLTYAGQLQRPLMLIHGTADDNVYFAHSLQLANQLVMAAKPFVFLPLSGATHMIHKPKQRLSVLHQTAAYLFRHLRKVSPR
jgi:dipeptidyl-peptidase-4